MFVIPYFFIVGFDKGDVAEKFFWYWLVQALYMSVMVFIGHFLSCAMSGAAAANGKNLRILCGFVQQCSFVILSAQTSPHHTTVIGGMLSTLISLFAGFLIRPENFPSFWIFMYWLNPLHYAIEGLMVTQFNKDHTEIALTGTTETTTANTFVQSFFTEWRYSHAGLDVLALLLFIVGLR